MASRMRSPERQRVSLAAQHTGVDRLVQTSGDGDDACPATVARSVWHELGAPAGSPRRASTVAGAIDESRRSTVSRKVEGSGCSSVSTTPPSTRREPSWSSAEQLDDESGLPAVLARRSVSVAPGAALVNEATSDPTAASSSGLSVTRRWLTPSSGEDAIEERRPRCRSQRQRQCDRQRLEPPGQRGDAPQLQLVRPVQILGDRHHLPVGVLHRFDDDHGEAGGCPRRRPGSRTARPAAPQPFPGRAGHGQAGPARSRRRRLATQAFPSSSPGLERADHIGLADAGLAFQHQRPAAALGEPGEHPGRWRPTRTRPNTGFIAVWPSLPDTAKRRHWSAKPLSRVPPGEANAGHGPNELADYIDTSTFPPAARSRDWAAAFTASPHQVIGRSHDLAGVDPDPEAGTPARQPLCTGREPTFAWRGVWNSSIRPSPSDFDLPAAVRLDALPHGLEQALDGSGAGDVAQLAPAARSTLQHRQKDDPTVHPTAGYDSLIAARSRLPPKYGNSRMSAGETLLRSGHEHDHHGAQPHPPRHPRHAGGTNSDQGAEPKELVRQLPPASPPPRRRRAALQRAPGDPTLAPASSPPASPSWPQCGGTGRRSTWLLAYAAFAVPHLAAITAASREVRTCSTSPCSTGLALRSGVRSEATWRGQRASAGHGVAPQLRKGIKDEAQPAHWARRAG